MAVALDVAGTWTNTANAASPQTYTLLTTGTGLSNGAVCFIVCVDQKTITGTAATWDGVACTKVASQSATGTFGLVELWALSPLSTHEGAKTFSYSWSGGPGSAQTFIVGCSFTGVNQTGGVTSFPNGVGSAS